MKTRSSSFLRSTRSVAATVLAAFSYTAIPAFALTNLYWDGTDTTANADGGDGTWNTTDTNWDTLATAGADAAFVGVNTNVAFFSGAGAVTLASNVSPNSIGSSSGLYTFDLAGNNLTTYGSGITWTSGSLVVSGAGNMVLGADQTWSLTAGVAVTVSSKITGGFSLSKGNGGDLILSNDTNDFTGKLFMQNGGSIKVSSIADSTAPSAAGAGGTIELGQNGYLFYIGSGSSTTNRTLTLSNVSAGGSGNQINNTGAGTLIFTGTVNNTAGLSNGTLTLGGTNTGANEIQGGIANRVGFTQSISKNDAGTWILSGANTYTGTTVVTGGTLQFSKTTSLYNGNTANWTAANINVKNAATLALNVDSAGTAGFDSTSLDTLLTSISVAPSNFQGLLNGSKLALDTSTATGGTFTQGNPIANSTGASSGPIGLTKLGIGTLVLDKTNTYTGATTINAGTLLVNGSLSATSVTVAASGTLGGTGTLGGSTTVNGSLAPGASVGKLTINSTLTLGTLAANSLKFELGASTTAGTTYDTVATSALAIGGGTLDFADFQFTNTGTLAAGSYTLISSSAAITGTLGGSLTGAIGAFTGTLSITGGNTLVLTVTAGGSPYTTWANTFLPGNDVSNPAGDNDNDGLVNQQEFAFGLSPISGSSVNPILVQLDKSAGTFTYQRRAATGLTYKILTSTTLAAGSWTEDVPATAGQTDTPSGSNETVVVTLTGAPLTAAKLFVRVSAE